MKLSRFAAPLLLILLMVGVTACDSGSDPSDPPGINGPALQLEGGRGTTVDVSLNLEAEAGLQSLSVSVNGGAAEAVSIQAGAEQQDVTYMFTIPADSRLGDAYALVFTLTDEDDVTSTITANVTTSKLIETPTTYTFTRNGQSTVNYDGQNDRLAHVEEIKALLRTADNGAVITEQALLDMFGNTGDNGGGNFSFTSDRQLRNKTFELDIPLFEGLFASAATASQAGAAGTVATNGTAGLIERASGSTILVDENGREFVQLIEKGLMGAVFYNQIYNVYLTDTRIGDDVENTALSEGRNYTAMEHHWDEAFGYFNPPLDFTSPWPSDRRDEDRFWANYSTTVDNVDGNGTLGTNARLMTAYLEGRAAIVNNDLATKDTQRDALYQLHDLVTAGTAVHYINDTLEALDQNEIGEAFHVLSEAWAFTNALKYNPNRVLSVQEIETIMESDYGADGNFWNVTPAGLNAAKAKLVAAYPELAPVQDDL
ncbi:MAG: DUF4856 domain-containing protein [Bacteroidota bacterium]